MFKSKKLLENLALLHWDFLYFLGWFFLSIEFNHLFMFFPWISISALSKPKETGQLQKAQGPHLGSQQHIWKTSQYVLVLRNHPDKQKPWICQRKMVKQLAGV